MRILVMLLLDTLPVIINILFRSSMIDSSFNFSQTTNDQMLGNVLLLCFFVFFIFGIIGVQLWAGLLRQRCFLSLPPNTSIPDR